MMRNRTPRRSPRRRPRHAAAARLARPYRLRDRRATRLLAIAGSAVAGLSLVVGAVALVAEITALPSATHVTVTARQKPVRRLAAAGRPAARTGSGRQDRRSWRSLPGMARAAPSASR